MRLCIGSNRRQSAGKTRSAALLHLCPEPGERDALTSIACCIGTSANRTDQPAPASTTDSGQGRQEQRDVTSEFGQCSIRSASNNGGNRSFRAISDQIAVQQFVITHGLCCRQSSLIGYLVDEPVRIEPVSYPSSLLAGNLTGNVQNLPPLKSQIPCSAEQEFFHEHQVIKRPIAGEWAAWKFAPSASKGSIALSSNVESTCQILSSRACFLHR